MEPSPAKICGDEQCRLGHSFIDPHVTGEVASLPFRLKLSDPLISVFVCQSELPAPEEILNVSRIELEFNRGVTARNRNDTTCLDLAD